jgi:two-component system nitrate/nitrite response regulator NarL
MARIHAKVSTAAKIRGTIRDSPAYVSIRHDKTEHKPKRNRVKVLLADDAAVIRSCVSHLLKVEPAIELIGVAENFSQTLQKAASMRPDVVLLDLHMPDSCAFDPAFVKSQLTLSGACVLGMSLSSGEDDEESRLLAETFGAVAVLDKAEFGHQLIPEILRLCASVAALNPSAT